MRTLVIGDIHGCRASLLQLLALVRPDPADLTVILGDLVDRGPDSCGVLDSVMELALSHRLVVLRGNHEELMLDALEKGGPYRDLWLQLGGDAALASYPQGIPKPEHTAFLRDRCVDWYETATHIFVHGGVQHDLPMEQQPVQHLRWATLNPPPTHRSGKTIICGHSPQATGRPICLKQAICIDTGSGTGNGWLTCLHCESGEYWQTNDQGDQRKGDIKGLA